MAPKSPLLACCALLVAAATAGCLSKVAHAAPSEACMDAATAFASASNRLTTFWFSDLKALAANTSACQSSLANARSSYNAARADIAQIPRDYVAMLQSVGSALQAAQPAFAADACRLASALDLLFEFNDTSHNVTVQCDGSSIDLATTQQIVADLYANVGPWLVVHWQKGASGSPPTYSIASLEQTVAVASLFFYLKHDANHPHLLHQQGSVASEPSSSMQQPAGSHGLSSLFRNWDIKKKLDDVVSRVHGHGKDVESELLDFLAGPMAHEHVVEEEETESASVEGHVVASRHRLSILSSLDNKSIGLQHALAISKAVFVSRIAAHRISRGSSDFIPVAIWLALGPQHP